ncbi:protein-disulfide reductase DsbD [Marinobacterium sp. CAU 1594]|nr:protein-disulfide reductase DsbD [Marinobacterium arenosum]
MSFHILLSLLLTSWLAVPLARAGLFDSNPLGGADGPLPVEQAFVFQPQESENGQLMLFWKVTDDYYLYRDRVKLVPSDGIALHGRVNAPAQQKDDPLFGRVWVYKHTGQIDLQFVSTTGEPVDGSVEVSYQGCWEGGICYPPVTQVVPLSQVPVAASLPAPLAEPAAPVAPAVTEAPQQPEQDRFAAMIGQGSFLLTLGAFLLAGLGLAFTPCVFPMIPILSSIIAGQGHKITTGRAFGLSLVYVLSVSVTYTLAGVAAGLFGANLQAAFQNPWIIGLFSGLFVVLALAMFGFYELQLPSLWQSRLSHLTSGQKGGSLLGVAIMGLLSALIVGPCMAAPLAGALIYIGQTGDPLLGGAALFSLSLGMGVPLLLLGVSAGKLLPKAGPWMAGVKAAFGVMLLAMAIWMLDRVVPTELSMLLAAALLLVTAVYMSALDRLPENASGWRKLWKGLGVILLVYGGALSVGVLSGSQSFLRPLQGLAGSAVERPALPFNTVTTEAELDRLLAQAQQNGQPVMLDFYADWCISCVELEEFTFKDSSVMQSLDTFMLIRVDVTANDDDAKVLSRRYGVIGPPALVFYDRQGRQRDHMMLIGVIGPDDFVRHLGQLDS